MRDKKLVIFGPWCGEFCYELSWWIPEIRKKRGSDFADYDAIAVGFDGRKILYKDFTEGYIPYSPELSDTLLYPATFGEHVNGADIIPVNVQLFVQDIVDKKAAESSYSEIIFFSPTDACEGAPLGGRERLHWIMQELPFGDYRHYRASPLILNQVKREIAFNNPRDTVAIMARTRHRLGEVCYLDWDPDHWDQLINLLIEDLKLNIVTIGITQPKGSSGGASLSFDESPYLKNIHFSGPDSVERQIALLQATKCSLYGASGTAVFPFFVKGAATFTQQTIEEGFRLKFQWERDLTNNLEKVGIFDKYHNREIYNSPPEELFLEFKEFYTQLNE